MIIHRELGKMGLPVPEISTLTVYFNTILWPAIEKFHLQSVYADYKGKLNGGESNLFGCCAFERPGVGRYEGKNL